MNLLKTNCDGCGFRLVPIGCEAKKEVFASKQKDSEIIYQFTEGFCAQKRPHIWAFSQGSFNNAIEKTVEEERNLSVIISDTTGSCKDIIKTLESLLNDTELINNVLIVTQNSTKRWANNLTDLLINYCKYPWAVENVVYENSVDALGLINYAVFKSKAPWFLSLDSGEKVPQKSIAVVDYSIKAKLNNLAFYFDEENHTRMFGNTVAFKEMQGHIETPWLKKLQEFDNWKKICSKI